MIKIKMEFATGEQARAELLALLGSNALQSTVVEKTKEEQKAAKEEATATATAEPEPEKAVKVARKAKSTEVEKPAEIKDEPGVEGTVKKEDLQRKAVELGRQGKRELCRAILKKFGAESISTEPGALDPAKYEEVLAEFNTL